MDSLTGVIERLTFHNPDNGYTVARVSTRRGLVTVVGNMAGVHVGASVEMRGEWTNHPKFGRQFKVADYRTVLPATAAGVEKYLGSGLIKGVGPVTAKRIVQHFGADALRIIDEEPDRLRDVLGVGKKRVAMIKKAWEEQKQIKEVMIFLQSHGVSAGLAVKIYKRYGDGAIGVLQMNPYQLQRDIHGIGFKTADKIARSLGIPHDSPERVAAGVQYVLNQETDQGNVFTPREALVTKASELLEVPPELVEEAIHRLQAEEQVKVEGVGCEVRPEAVQLKESQAVYLASMYYSEVGVAAGLRRLNDARLATGTTRLPAFQTFDWDQAFRYLQRQLGVDLAPAQRQAVQTALTQPVTVLTGGPGTGKTTTLRAIIHLLRAASATFALAAPTGRAAKRMSEVTGAEARTIHRLLEASPGEGFSFKRNAENPLDVDMVIVDEASMLDVILTNHVLKAIPAGAHLLLVGDVDQLPSVGAGNVLRDIIDSGEVAVVRLETIFRQAAGSYIITNAHRINRGQMPLFPKDANDFFLFPMEDVDAAADMVVDLVTRRIPNRFGIPSAEIQVLTPMHRGPLGVTALNQRLQEKLNPAHPAKPLRIQGGRVLRVGDRVMQIRNNYDLDVFNGDMGVITGVDLEMQTLTVDFDGRAVTYDWASLDELTHAWAISVHKSQGSEFRAVVMPVHTTHYIMLQRNLLYTGVTRARELAVLVGTKRAIGIAVRNDQVAERHTALAERLAEPHPTPIR
ncbi:MAG TPA: ATP-dependent RecD-like DNA helicase [Caldilineales bacterium]|nr:ATP-dependent RecD-like DNA helicase [Caldilineales bacterium]